MAFPEGDPETVAGNKERAGADHRLAGGGLARDGRQSFAVAGDGFNEARLGVHLADAMIADIGDVDVVFVIESDAVGRAELSLGRGATVAAKAFFAGAGDR